MIIIIGVYQIKNIKNGKMYIGSSKDIERRWKEHLYNLENNTHHSIKLQRSYNKTKDKSIFKFEVIEESSENNLKECEQYYINLYDSFNNGCNCCERVDNSQYSLSNAKKKIVDTAYKEFVDNYQKYSLSLIFKNAFLNRLLEKYYKINVYKNINSIIVWFVNNYNSDCYNGRLYVTGSRQYYLVVSDTSGNEFVCYKWYKNKMQNSYHDTKTLRDILVENNKLNKNEHYIVNV